DVSESRVAEFRAFDVPRAAPAPVVRLDDVAGRTRDRSAGGPVDGSPDRRRAGRRPGGRRADTVTAAADRVAADRVAADCVAADPVDAARVDVDRPRADRARSGRSEPDVMSGERSDDGIPPDGPLPRGRR